MVERVTISASSTVRHRSAIAVAMVLLAGASAASAAAGSVSHPAFGAAQVEGSKTLGPAGLEARAGSTRSASSDAIVSASSAVSPAPCGLPGACESSNPTYEVYYSSSSGDSSGCRFELHIDWGDGSQET